MSESEGMQYFRKNTVKFPITDDMILMSFTATDEQRAAARERIAKREVEYKHQESERWAAMSVWEKTQQRWRLARWAVRRKYEQLVPWTIVRRDERCGCE